MGILWRKSLDAFPISEIDSKRVCGIRIKKEDDTWMSIIGAYLPCADLGMDYFRDTLAELEKVISDSTNLGPVVVAVISMHTSATYGAHAALPLLTPKEFC